ncbi:AAA family ATPase [Acetohalobium arabaticum]|uniref:Transcriptional activator domain protein n=1 Tax=Acetohalobium arabaticum (strain ATCC 49924 / DSM 5501 / Z-7288) TaxID=574087 RepID=D9QSH5_ACEAZ|nr:AAA family ATPase [Acetohalobium arabaticum]ADL13438.1 transcriptional activator domain protein [Acetohalobium arabaticum DSM 5501]
MPKLEVTVLGTPVVELDGKPIDFPYKKVEALLYYLVVKKKTRRNKLASLLWGDMEESKAKKNLRNALYQLKKTVGDQVIETPDRFIVTLDDNCDLQLDLDEFLANKDASSIKLYEGEFLNDFLVKNASEFNDWVFEQMNYCEQLYIKLLKQQIKECKAAGQLQQGISYLETLLEVNEFDEIAYRDLMEFYSEQGNIAKAIETYKLLEDQLETKLGITPDKKTVELLQNIKENISANIEEDNSIDKEFIGREEELEAVMNLLYRFTAGAQNHSCFVFGEAGIGKTELVRQALASVRLENCLVVKTNCYQAEERYIFKPWKNILQQLKEQINLANIDLPPLWKRAISFLFPSILTEDDESALDELVNCDSIQYQSAVEALLFLVSEIAKEQKLVLVFEDLQWCDDRSLLLLRNLIRENENNNILVLATSRNQRRERVEEFFADLKRHDLLTEITLNRLNLSEVKDFAQKTLPDYQFSKDLLIKIHQETEGNIFFLVELLNLLAEDGKEEALANLLTVKSKNILRNRVLSVSKEAQKILRLASICFDNFSYELLAAISDKNDLELIEILEELQNYYLIEELSVNQREGLTYRFTHSKLREFIYEQQSRSRVRLLHRRIAQFFEEQLQETARSRNYYSKLIHHYSQAGDKFKHLTYLIKEAEMYFYYTHELFPIISDRRLAKDNILSFNQEWPQYYLSKVEDLLKEIEWKSDNSFELRKMEVKFLNLQSHFLIAQGDYEAAIDQIEKLINEAKLINDYGILLEAYEKMASLGIQKENTNLIEKNAVEMYDLAKKQKANVKEGIALRFLGIVRLYQRQYSKAEELFNQALDVFKEAETVRKKYTLGIATVYNYLGEVKRYQGEFEQAINFYQHSIDLCENQDILSGVGIFYVNAGQMFYKLENYKKAQNYFFQSLKIFQQLRTIWGYSVIANSFMALLSIQTGSYKEAYDYIVNSDAIIEQCYKRYWAGILLRSKAEIAKQMNNDNQLREVFSDRLDLDYRKYAQQALDIFEAIGADYEVELMKKL